MTNKELKQMTTIEADIKAVSKVIGNSLKRAGHDVPHSAVLNAVATALNKRNWQALKACVTDLVVAEKAPNESSKGFSSYSARTAFALRLAVACGTPVEQVPLDDNNALLAAQAMLPSELPGVLSWEGWNVPATLNPVTSTIDAGVLRPEGSNVKGSLTLRFPGMAVPLVVDVAYLTLGVSQEGWYPTTQGVIHAYAMMEELIPDVGAKPNTRLAPVAGPTVFEGEAISAEFWTDDRVMEHKFDARAYFMQATARDIENIIRCGYRGDYPTDNIAEYFADRKLIEELVQGFAYLDLMRNSSAKNPLGFECSVDPRELLTWLDSYRKAELAIALCSIVGYGVLNSPSALQLYASEDMLDKALALEV